MEARPGSALGALAREPSLWPTAVRQAVRLVPRRWWARAPFLPVPSRAYYRFRMETQYGDPTHPAASGDLVTYLRWCRAWNRNCRRGAEGSA